MDMLCFMHQSEDRGKLVLNGNAVSDETLGRILGLDKQKITSALKSIFHHGVASRDIETGAIINRRMVRDEEIRRIRSKYGSMGGNPLFAKGKTNPYYDGGAKKDKQNDNLPDNQTDKQSDNQKISSSSSASTKTEKEDSLRSLQKDDGEDKQTGKQGAPIPKDFEPDAKSEEHRLLGCSHIIDKKFEIALCEFKAYWEDLTGAKARKKDWQRAWRLRLDVLQQREVERFERERSWSHAGAAADEIAADLAALELAEDKRIITEFQAHPKYKHLNVQDFYTAMNKHCVESGETPTRDLLVTWLDYALTERGNGSDIGAAPLFDTALPAEDDFGDFKLQPEDEL